MHKHDRVSSTWCCSGQWEGSPGNCFYDITARKETEERLRDSDRRKTEFLAMLGHELRNPLAPILNSLAVIRGARMLESSSSRTSSVRTAMDVLDRQVGKMGLVDLGARKQEVSSS